MPTYDTLHRTSPRINLNVIAILEQWLRRSVAYVVSMERAMNTFARRDQILNDFRKESNGSFSAVYRAMSELSTEKKTSKLDEQEVKARIREIIKEQRVHGD